MYFKLFKSIQYDLRYKRQLVYWKEKKSVLFRSISSRLSCSTFLSLFSSWTYFLWQWSDVIQQSGFTGSRYSIVILGKLQTDNLDLTNLVNQLLEIWHYSDYMSLIFLVLLFFNRASKSSWYIKWLRYTITVSSKSYCSTYSFSNWLYKSCKK